MLFGAKVILWPKLVLIRPFVHVRNLVNSALEIMDWTLKNLDKLLKVNNNYKGTVLSVFSSDHWLFGKHWEKWLLFCLSWRPSSWAAMARTWWLEGTMVWWRSGRPVTLSSCTFTLDVTPALERWTYPMTRGEPQQGKMPSLENCHGKFCSSRGEMCCE